MPKSYKYFGVFSPKSNYLNFVVSASFPEGIDAFDAVRYLIYSKWDVREVSFADVLNYEARYFYRIDIGCHCFAIGARNLINPGAFFIKLARRHLSQESFHL